MQKNRNKLLKLNLNGNSLLSVSCEYIFQSETFSLSRKFVYSIAIKLDLKLYVKT